MALDREDFDRLDERYVRITDCHTVMDKEDERVTNIDKTLAVLTAKIGTTNKILLTVAAPIVAIAVKLLFGA